MRSAAIVATLALFAGVSFAQTPAPTAAQVLAKWRAAVHAQNVGNPQAAIAASTSNEDGIPGSIEEWNTTAGDYRREVKRQFDESETVLAPRSAARRDWNGWLRPVQGKELARLVTAAFEQATLLFGPQPLWRAAELLPGTDLSLYRLRVTPRGGEPIIWYIDAKTYLPVKSERPGDDSVITTSYSDWRDIGGLFTAGRASVGETEKPTYEWQRVSVKRVGPASLRFAPPKPGPSDVRMDATVPPVPFRFEASHIVLPASVNGRPPAWFILDTGADQEVINSTRLAEFGLQTYAKSLATGGGGTAEYTYASGATFRLPGVELTNQHVAVIDQTGLEHALGVPLGGLLGYDFISRFVIEIDYGRKFLMLRDPKDWKYSGKGFVVPVTFDDGIPFTNGAISVPTKPNIPAYLVLDFGAMETMTLTSPFVKANDLARLAGTNSNVNGPALAKQFFSQTNIRGRIQQLTIGRLQARSIPINMSVNTEGAYASPNFAGTVGETLFSRYHVFLDYARNRVIFEPTPEAAKPFPDRQTFGLTLLASGPELHTFTVAAVRPGSPAATAGFEKNDVIDALDGKPSAQFTLGELRDTLSRPGERHVLQVKRGGTMLTFPLEVKLVSLDQ